jgi:hypothetical protein
VEVDQVVHAPVLVPGAPVLVLAVADNHVAGSNIQEI